MRSILSWAKVDTIPCYFQSQFLLAICSLYANHPGVSKYLVSQSEICHSLNIELPEVNDE